ncbi:unnamed protein product [Effrenium voratum]|uniref:Uncharacterized protein n=1 Tax=Effrenium voratum TaxID=2562239 RepID=A0AA36J1A6_9DINO|nr:unnamed protein product [Effrenium voratum]
MRSLLLLWTAAALRTVKLASPDHRQIFFFRHGETEPVAARWLDDTGVAQCQSFARDLRSRPEGLRGFAWADCVFASPQNCAVQSALLALSPLLLERNLSVVLLPDLQPQVFPWRVKNHHPQGEDIQQEAIRKLAQSAVPEPLLRGLAQVPVDASRAKGRWAIPRPESSAEVQERMLRFVQQLYGDFGHCRRSIVVGHSQNLKAALLKLWAHSADASFGYIPSWYQGPTADWHGLLNSSHLYEDSLAYGSILQASLAEEPGLLEPRLLWDSRLESWAIRFGRCGGSGVALNARGEETGDFCACPYGQCIGSGCGENMAAWPFPHSQNVFHSSCKGCSCGEARHRCKEFATAEQCVQGVSFTGHPCEWCEVHGTCRATGIDVSCPDTCCMSQVEGSRCLSRLGASSCPLRAAGLAAKGAPVGFDAMAARRLAEASASGGRVTAGAPALGVVAALTAPCAVQGGGWAPEVQAWNSSLVFPFEGERRGVGVHATLWAQLQPRLAELRARLEQKPRPVFLTGHGLGGGLATLAALALEAAGVELAGLATFGAPRVGNLAFAVALRRALEGKPLWRVTVRRDPVVQVPARELGFWHVAGEVFFPDAASSSYVLDDGSGEDPKGAGQYEGAPLKFIADHLSYMNVSMPCAALPEPAVWKKSTDLAAAVVETRSPDVVFRYQGAPFEAANVGRNVAFQGLNTKTKQWLHFLAGQSPDQLVLLTDANDVIFGGCDQKQLIRNYEAVATLGGAPVVMGAELGSRPERLMANFSALESRRQRVLRAFAVPADGYAARADCTASFGPCSNPPAYQFLNSGFYMGPAKDVKEVLEAALDYECDQDGAAEYMLLHPDKVTLDYAGALVLNLHNFHQDEKLLKVETVNKQLRLHNQVTGMTQCFVHGNGNGKEFVSRLAARWLPALAWDDRDPHLQAVPECATAPLVDDAALRLGSRPFRPPRTGELLRACHGSGSKALEVVVPCQANGCGLRAEVPWILRVMLGFSDIRASCLEDLYNSSEKGGPGVRPGQVLVLTSRKYQMGLDVARAANVPLSQLVLVHIADETKADQAAWAQRYLSWRFVFRNYWVDDQQGSFERLLEQDRLAYFPLGPTPQLLSLPRDRLASQRSVRVFFSGRAGNGAERLGRLGAAQRRLGAKLLVQTTTERKYGCYDSEYVQRLTDSAMCLQIPGNSVECFRLYESLEAGCVPVVVRAWSSPNGSDPLVKLQVDGQPPPFLYVDRPEDLPQVLQLTPAELDLAQARAGAWWAKAKRRFREVFAHQLRPPEAPTGILSWRQALAAGSEIWAFGALYLLLVLCLTNLRPSEVEPEAPGMLLEVEVVRVGSIALIVMGHFWTMRMELPLLQHGQNHVWNLVAISGLVTHKSKVWPLMSYFRKRFARCLVCYQLACLAAAALSLPKLRAEWALSFLGLQTWQLPWAPACNERFDIAECVGLELNAPLWTMPGLFLCWALYPAVVLIADRVQSLAPSLSTAAVLACSGLCYVLSMMLLQSRFFMWPPAFLVPFLFGLCCAELRRRAAAPNRAAWSAWAARAAGPLAALLLLTGQPDAVGPPGWQLPLLLPLAAKPSTEKAPLEMSLWQSLWQTLGRGSLVAYMFQLPLAQLFLVLWRLMGLDGIAELHPRSPEQAWTKGFPAMGSGAFAVYFCVLWALSCFCAVRWMSAEVAGLDALEEA